MPTSVIAGGTICRLGKQKLNDFSVGEAKKVKVKGKGRYSSSWEPHLRATGRHLPYEITQCYLPPDTSERGPLTLATQAGTRFTYPGGMEG